MRCKAASKQKLRLTTEVSPYASRAVGLLRGRIVPAPNEGPRNFNLFVKESDGNETIIPGIMFDQAQRMIIENPSLLMGEADVLCYPRTVGKELHIQAFELSPSNGKYHPDQDIFLISGMNLGSRYPGRVKIGIRPNRTKKQQKQQFERFWLHLHGFVEGNHRCFYHLRTLRKGSRLYIVESTPRLPEKTDANHHPSEPSSNGRVLVGAK
jgi:hypothetical protein